jgi:3-isopropylmalate/(R)-2-methylmalate dehydratase small subunit
MIITGLVWRVGDDVDTDQILPARHINEPDRKERASHCFENLIPGFAGRVRPGDVVVGGRNFGCGSSRPSVEILQELGLAGVVAVSFARIFFRGGIARGFPLVVCPDLKLGDLPAGCRVTADLSSGLVRDETSGHTFRAEPYPPFLQEIIRAGGLMAHTRDRLAESKNT